MWNFTTEASSPEIPLYNRLLNTLFYLAVIPVATVGNLLAIAVVFYIIKHHRTRRSCIPDMGLGVLAGVDLFSVVCVHSLTIAAMWKGWDTLPNKTCVFQAFSSSVYLKMQFLVQITISLDRYFALVRPLRYHSVSSLKAMRFVLLAILVLSVGTTALTMAFAVEDILPLETWQFCIYEWRLRSASDYTLVAIFGFVFFLGLLAFFGSNVSLVRILWRYHARRGDSVLREISHAVDVMKRDKNKPPLRTPQIPELKEPSSPNGNLVQNVGAAINGAKNSLSTTTKIDHNGKLHLGRAINEAGIELESKLHNGTRVRGSIGNQLTEGNIPTDTSRGTHGQTWYEGSGLMQPPAGNAASKPQTLDIHDVNLVSPSSYVSIDGHEVLWKLGGSDVEETNALLYNDQRSCTSLQNSITPLDQSPNTRSSFLADNSDQDLGALFNSPDDQLHHGDGGEGFHNAQCVPAFSSSASSKLNVSPLNLLARDSTNMLPVPLMIPRSLSTDNNVAAVPNKTNPRFPKSKSFDEVLKLDIPPKNHGPKMHTSASSNQVIPQIQTPPSPSNHVTSRNDASDNPIKGAKKSFQVPSLLHVSPQPSGRDPSTSPGLPRLGSSTASSGRHVQLQYFQHQVKRVLRKLQKKAHKQQKEMILAKLVLMCALTFIVTWLPYVAVIILDVFGVVAHPMVEDIAIKLVFANAMLNPIFYGLCRRNYRKGYDYVSQLFCYRITCGCIKKPGEDKVFYESRKRKVRRHLQAAKMDKQVKEMKKQQRNACALQILHHTLHLHSATLLPRVPTGSPPAASPRSPAEFAPSKRLQALFEQYMLESDSDSDYSSSSVDYDALVYGEDDLYKSLRKVWSVCINTGDLGNSRDFDADPDADIELDIDYDALLADDNGPDTAFLFPPVMSDNRSDIGEQMPGADVMPRLAMSTPNFENLQDRFYKENGC